MRRPGVPFTIYYFSIQQLVSRSNYHWPWSSVLCAVYSLLGKLISNKPTYLPLRKVGLNGCVHCARRQDGISKQSEKLELWRKRSSYRLHTQTRKSNQKQTATSSSKTEKGAKEAEKPKPRQKVEGTKDKG